MNKPFTLAFLAIAAATAAVTVQAQPAATPAGAQPAAPTASASRPGPRAGAGPMMGHWGLSYTPGWRLMTPKERDAHRDAMRGARNYEDCRKALDEHRALMQQRAQEKGVSLRTPRRDACGGLPKG